MASPKRPPRAEPAETVPSALVVKGLDASDIAALDSELSARRATLPSGATISRNALVVALIREALDASAERRSKAST